MDREKLKLIYKNLKSLLDCLESEIYSDTEAYKKDLKKITIEDDDGYTD